jgi:outer membrane protein assembly factor BamB
VPTVILPVCQELLETKVGTFQTSEKVYSSPAVGADGAVYVGSLDGHLYALNADGTLRWKANLRDWVISSPAVGADETVYVGGYSRALYAVNGQGQMAWKYETGKYVFSSPTIATDGTLYVGSDDGNIYALKMDRKGLSVSPWPKFRGNVRNTGRIYRAGELK